MPGELPYKIFPLGDSAITLDYGNTIDETINRRVITLFRSLNNEPLQGMTEAVPAYSSLTIYYDPVRLRKQVPAGKTVYEWMAEQIEQRLQLPIQEDDLSSGLVKIPVCYEKEFAPDIEEIASTKYISFDEVIQIHTSKAYRVYMLGFIPGFAYMGEVDEKIAMPRKIQPRQKVEAGSVGIAGKQTGIYPLASPGGWQIIGRTPIKLFNAAPSNPALPAGRLPGGETFENSLCLLHPGDNVQFYSITVNDFYEIQNSPSQS